MKNKKRIIIFILLILVLIGGLSYNFKHEIYNKFNHVEDICEGEPKNESTIEIGEVAYKIPVITYHRIMTHEIKTGYFVDNEWANDIDEIAKQLEYIYNEGWQAIDLDTFYKWMNKSIDLPEKTFVIIIDDGDLEAYTLLLPVLEEYNFHATLFAIGSQIPLTTPEADGPKRLKVGLDVIEKLNNSDSLLKVQSHSYNLHYVDEKTGKEAAFIKTKEELVEDFELNEKYGFEYMAYPYGAYTDEMLEAVSESNIKMAFTFKKKDYATQDENIYEVSRLKVNGFTTLDEFKEIFSYVDC